MTARTIMLVCVMSLSAATVGLYLVPNHKEIALMHMGNADFGQALTYYTSLHAEGDDTISTVAPLVNLHIHFGEIDQAIALLEDYIAEHPCSLEAHKLLAKLYQNSQRYNSLCHELEQLQNLSPSVDNLRGLASLYDFLGRYKEEQRTLAKLIEESKYVPREEDYVKLAILDMTTDHRDDAIEVLVDGLQHRLHAVSSETILLTVQLLLDSKKSGEAKDVALAYLKKNGTESNVIDISSLFQSYDQLDLAYAVVAPYQTNIDNLHEIERQTVGVLLDQKKEAEVYALLSRQYGQHILPTSLMPVFADLSIKHKDRATVISLASSPDLTQMPEDSLVRMTEYLFQIKAHDGAQSMLEILGEGYLKEAPLLSALLNVVAHDTSEAMNALLNLPPSAIATEEEKMIVAGILVEHGNLGRAYTLLENSPITEVLSLLTPEQLAEIYLESHDVEKNEKKLTEIRHSVSPALQSSIDMTLFLLAAGEGKTDAVMGWLKQHPENNKLALLSTANDFAERYHRTDLALQIAQQVYVISPSLEHLLTVTEKLVDNHAYAEALRYLQKKPEENERTRSLTFEAMEGYLLHSASGEADTSKGSLLPEIQAELNKSSTTIDQKREFAYLLGKAGYITLAEDLLVQIAGSQPFHSRDVDELLGFWGDHPSPASLPWIEKRAREASGDDQIAWLSYLKDDNHPESIVAILGGASALSPPQLDIYLHALEDTHDTHQMEIALTRAIDNEQNPAQLKKLAGSAESVDLPRVSERAWLQLHKLDPADLDADKNLGLAAFGANRFAEAKPLLERYLQGTNESDYATNYAYAEILQHLGQKNEADPYYSKALQQLSALADKSEDMLVDQAHLLALNNRKAESIEMLRQLIAQYPQNMSIRAEYAGILIEKGQFDEASSVLAH